MAQNSLKTRGFTMPGTADRGRSGSSVVKGARAAVVKGGLSVVEGVRREG
ncbi:MULTISPECIES: hypothetical protein [unclassified Streptomyces]|nr:hypothetical protein OG199_21220 [Streptomyces sp. NBC_01176]